MSVPAYSVDIRGLTPRHAALLQGGLYAVAGEDEAVADALILQSLLSAHRGSNAFFATHRALPAMLRRHGPLAKAFRRAVHDEGIAVLRHRHGAGITPMAFVDALFADLVYYDYAEGALVVLDGAECLFGEDAAANLAIARRLRDWTEATGSVLMLVLRPSAAGSAVARLFPCSRVLTGLARIRHAGGAPAWEVFHWFGSGGVAGAQAFELIVNDNGTLAAAPDRSVATAAAPAADDRAVLAVRQAVQAKEAAPGHWELLDDFNALTARAADAVACTVVLPFSAAIGFDRLARCVYALRERCGPRLKIVVRELNLRLRYSQEALMLRLGANLIVPAEVGFARFLSLTDMVQGQVYPHRLPPSYEQAVADAAPEHEQGYLPPAAFVQAAAAVLDSSRTLGMQDVLLRLPLGYGLQPLDALRHCVIRRVGDLCTADDAGVYVLLHACREGDVDLTLGRLFQLPVAEFFSSESRYFSQEQVRDALEDLGARAARQSFADLSAELAVAMTAAAPAPAQQARAAVSGPQEVRYSAPPPAQRRPLRVRGVPNLVEVGALK